MIGWAWSGSASDAAGCGISPDQAEAFTAADTWFRMHPAGRVVFGQVRLPEGGDVLAALRSPRGKRLVAAGRGGWQEVSAHDLALRAAS